ncbi:MAG: hypothetical protein ACFB2Y_16320 [Fulvivirga sp.]
MDHSQLTFTVAKAIHWLDFDRFYKEVCRVVKPECLLAYLAYELPKIELALDKTVIHFHDEVLGDYWDVERRYWRKNIQIFYTHLRSFESREFIYKTIWRYENLEGYLSSWSADQHFIQRKGDNPVFKFLKTLKSKWTKSQQVEFPIFLYAGRV